MSEEELESTADEFDDTEQEGDGGSGKAKKLVLFVVVPILILVGAGVGLYASGILGGSSEPEAVEEAAYPEEDAITAEEASYSAVFLPIPDIVVNLKTKGKQPRFLRLRVQLEVENETQKESIEKVMPRVVDQFQTYLREMRIQDLEGSAGIYRLQKELIARVNSAAYPVEVQDVLFQEILIQ